MDQLLEKWIESFASGSRLLRRWALSGGISSGMTAFEVESPGGELVIYVLRQPGDWLLNEDPRAVSREADLLKVLKEAGIPVQNCVFVDQEGEYFERPGLVLEFIEGKVDLQPNNLESYLRQMAEQLIAIHQLETEWPTLRDQVLLPGSAWLEQSQPVYRQAHEKLTDHWPIANSRKLCLLHGDFWPGNVLWRDHQLVGVIDWEEPCLGDPLMDLAVSRLDLFWIFGKQAMERFTDFYFASHPIDRRNLPLWDLYAGLRPENRIETWAEVHPKLGRPDITADSMEQKRHEFVSDAVAQL